MSQLSFASFFDQAKATAPLTPAKPVLPAVNAQTMPRRMLTTDEARRQFVSVFRDTARNLRRWEVFSDFITLAASELDMARIRTQENIEQSRKICAKYSESDISNLHTLFSLMVCALEAKFHDFLGAIFMELELGDDRNGQYFTPYHLQSLMAKLLMPDVEQTIRREGFVTVSDPASGAAGTVLSALLLFSTAVLANTQYDNASKYADSMKGTGMSALKGSHPDTTTLAGADVPPVTPRKTESVPYHLTSQ